MDVINKDPLPWMVRVEWLPVENPPCITPTVQKDVNNIITYSCWVLSFSMSILLGDIHK